MVTGDTIEDVPFAREAALTMGIPRNRTVRRVGAEADPLVAGCTADTVGLKLGNIWVVAEVLDALLFGTLSPPALRGWASGSGFR